MLKTMRLQLVIHSIMHGTTLTLTKLDSVSVFQLAGKEKQKKKIGVILKPYVKPRENSNFLKNCKMVISVKIRNFSRSRITEQTSPLESSREI